MEYRQLRAPDFGQTDYAGFCLRLARAVFGISAVFEYAWQSWTNSKAKGTAHTDALPNAIVPVFYTWTGTIDGITRNWGDVAIYVPGRGVYGSPQKGSPKSGRWDASVEARRRWLGGGAEYVGWTEDLNGVKVIEKVAASQPAPQQGDVVMNPNEEKEAYQIVLERPMEHGGSGRTGIRFMRDAVPELNLKREAIKQKDIYIQALQNDLNEMKRQADELAKRPTRSAFDELHNNLTVCASGAQEKVNYIYDLEGQLKTMQERQYISSDDEKFVIRILNGAKKLLPLDKIIGIFKK